MSLSYPQRAADMILINKANNPLIAAGFLLRGIKLLTNPKLRLLILVPILINIVVYSVALALGYYYVGMLMDQFIPESLQWLNWILWPLFFISFFIAGFFTFTVLESDCRAFLWDTLGENPGCDQRQGAGCGTTLAARYCR